MPIYDYRCTECGDFEHTQSIKDQPLTICPHCGHDVKRLISHNVGIIFKGSGFYINDSRQSTSSLAKSSQSANTNAEKKTDSEKTADNTSEAKSDSKASTTTTSTSSATPTNDSTKAS